MKEIGGYFELETLISNEYYKNLIPLNTARSALYYAVRAKGIKKIYFPYYLCEVVSEYMKKFSVEVDYYNINNEFRPIFNKTLGTDEYLYIVNYYGQLDDNYILELKRKYDNIIVDNTQAFFQEPLLNVITIYTCRKYFGVPDGAYLNIDKKCSDDYEIDKSMNRMLHLLGRYENKASDYYKDFLSVDEGFKEQDIKQMSKLTHNILGAIDYKAVIRKREENFNFLYREFLELNKLNITKPKGPFMYPLYVRDGQRIRKELAAEGIYLPILWPNVVKCMNKESVEYDYAANIIPVPCDQRYSIDDMKYMINKIKKLISLIE